MDFLEPWLADNSSTLADELRREVPPGHILFNVPVSTIARRNDRDDVLFSLLDGSNRVAVVHMTWSVETGSNWPRAELFESIHFWAETVMKVDHGEFTA